MTPVEPLSEDSIIELARKLEVPIDDPFIKAALTYLRSAIRSRDERIELLEVAIVELLAAWDAAEVRNLLKAAEAGLVPDRRERKAIEALRAALGGGET